MESSKTIKLVPQAMTPQLMAELEAEGLIVRLCPHHDDLDAKKGETLGGLLYEPKEGFGPHKLITVTVNREGFAGFGTHPDKEEFWLIGDPDTNPMYIVIARMRLYELEGKIEQGTLNAGDFILMKATYNDPWVSFFIMNELVPHGEGIIDSNKGLPSFYVTESRDLPLDIVDLKGCELVIADS